MELQCKVQNYDWGKLGIESTVAKLLKSADPAVSIDESKPYAELWVGTHPNGPSLIIERDVLLSDYIKDNLDAIGPAVIRKFGVDVPFLLKVLSVRKALSIQAHPNKEHAEELHKTFPEMYKDPNHKPELAIALTPFEALCGFRLLTEIQQFVRQLPELRQMLPDDIVENFLSHPAQGESDKVLKPLFHSLMICNKDTVANGLNTLLERLSNEDESTQKQLLYPLVKRLHGDYPGDVGCWAPYFMNYMELRPGQAMFLKSNLPHAYLSGDCIECMACSDNVVRAGLTPKHIDVPSVDVRLQQLYCVECMACSDNVVRAGLTPKHIDVPTLVSMLDYSSYVMDQLLFSPQLEDENCCVWRPPVPDFAVAKIRVESGDSYNTINRASPSLILITSGSGTACDTEPISARPGQGIFLKASRQLTLTPAEGGHLEAYQAICNV